MKEVTWRKFSELIHSFMQEYAELRVTYLLEMNRHGSDIHALDKIARRAFGDLKRTDNQEGRDPFIEMKILWPRSSRVLITFRTAIF